MKKKTIWQELVDKLGRAPTAEECAIECKRIIEEAKIARAEKGKLPHQKR